MTAVEPLAVVDAGIDDVKKLRKYDLIVTPVAMVLIAIALAAVWMFSDMDATSRDILEWTKIRRQLLQHVNITFWSTLLVVGIAIPLGVLVTRKGFKRLSGPVLGFANAGQAIPSYGLLVLFFAWLGTGTTTVVLALVVFGILPVLRNTMVGLDQVDTSLLEAGKGMGYSRRQVLLRIELPLAVPIILAGIRTALVINVGTAALAFLIGGGALGETINSALKLQRNPPLFVGAALVALLALTIDWLAALAQNFLKPKGI